MHYQYYAKRNNHLGLQEFVAHHPIAPKWYPIRLMSMAIVLLVALATYLVVELILSKFLLLFGKRKFVACLLVSLIFKVAADLLVPMLPVATLAFRGIGLISPGLIANTSARQGLHITIPAVLVATYATFGIVRLLMLLF